MEITKSSKIQNSLYVKNYCIWAYNFHMTVTSNEIITRKVFVELPRDFHFFRNWNIWIGITWTKISSYMRDSTWRLFIVKKAKIFWSYVKHFWILADVRILIRMYNLDRSMQIKKKSKVFQFFIKCYYFNLYNPLKI